MAAPDIPEDFPRAVATGAVPGAQPKLLVREEAGQYLAETAAFDLQRRFEACDDLVQQLTRYTARKRAERPDWTPVQVREKVAASVRQKAFGWGLSPAEAEWVVRRLAALDPAVAPARDANS
jgi:hypothetical protein